MGNCFFSDQVAEATTMANHDGVSFTSDLASYFISGQAQLVYKGKLPDRQRLLCLQETIKLNNEGLKPFWLIDYDQQTTDIPANVTLRKVSDFENKKIDHEVKEQEILALLSRKAGNATNPFDWQSLTMKDRLILGILTVQELGEWVRALLTDGYVEVSADARAALITRIHGIDSNLLFSTKLEKPNSIRLTNKGWKATYQFKSRATTRNVFIAMAFTDNERKDLPPALREAFKNTLINLGWKPVLVDEVPHNDGVMDKIMASINEARFVVADLTYHKAGVYLEGGYAKGLGLPVIFSVSADHLGDCHFDVKHLNLIVWKDEADLAIKLSARIRATIL